jgi:hypothetical protein
MSISAEKIAAAADERPDLSLLGRSGPQVALTAEHVRGLAEIVAHESPENAAGPVAHLEAEGAVATVDQGVGAWVITAHRAGSMQWMTIATLDGTVVAQRDTDLNDGDDVAIGMYVLWGWAVVGPAVY